MFLKMTQKLLASLVLITFSAYPSTNGALLFWTKQKLSIPALQNFDDNTLDELLETMGHPETALYKSSSTFLLPEFKSVLEGYNTAYSPNGEIDVENSTEISGDDETDIQKIKSYTESLPPNTLSIISIPETRRYRREAPVSPAPSPAAISSTPSTSAEPQMPYSSSIPEGPVVYSAKSKKDETFALMYSSRPLLLRINNNPFYLGNTQPVMISVDTVAKETYHRLNVKVAPLEMGGGTVTLRFMFAKLNGYWSLTAVKITDANNTWNFNLTVDREVVFPARFSYHCNGNTSFSDEVGNAELYVYDMQVQIDAYESRFMDPYDCVTFTTAPIWSGLFVTALLGIGLIVALVALNDIKTMDKFDNYKTKQLSITVTE